MLYRDVMVNLANPAARGAAPAICLPATPICWACTWYTCGGTCGFSPVFTPVALTPGICPGATVIGPVPVPVGGDPAAVSEQLAALKSQLLEAIAEIERQEQALEQSS
jgi:hypothetical protein